jgi:hypothetical protein
VSDLDQFLDGQNGCGHTNDMIKNGKSNFTVSVFGKLGLNCFDNLKV